jgi:hypothetical protein
MRIVCNIKEEFDGFISIDGIKIDIDSLSPYKTPVLLEAYSMFIDKLADMLAIDGVNYAYLVNYMLLNSSDHFKYPGLDILLAYIYLLDKHVDEDVELEVFEPFDATFKECARLVCKRKGVKLNIVKESYRERKSDWFFNSPFFILNGLRALLFFKWMIGVYRRGFKRTDAVIKDVLVLSNIRFSSSDERNNHMFGCVIKELEKEGFSCKVLRYEAVDYPADLARFCRDFINQRVPYIGDYYSFSHILKVQKKFSKLKRRWKQLVDKDQLKRIFEFKGYNFYNLVRSRLDLLFNGLAYICTDAAEITKRILEKEEAKLILLDHEENLYGKGFMLNSRHKTTKVVALAHELIYPGNVHTYIKSKKALDNTGDAWRPLPDKKCVWGDYSKNILLEQCNYRPELIEITGNPKFDVILKKRFNKKEICKRYGLSNRPKVLFASQLKPKYYSWIVEMAMENPELEFIFKPHPREDIVLVKKFFSPNKPNNIITIDRLAPVYELIAACDYVLTLFSTVGFEAMLFGKVVFVMNAEAELPRGLPYIEHDSVIVIKSPSEFKGWIEWLSVKKNKENLQKKAKQFVDFIHYKSDGRASERVVASMQKLYKNQ